MKFVVSKSARVRIIPGAQALFVRFDGILVRAGQDVAPAVPAGDARHGSPARDPRWLAADRAGDGVDIAGFILAHHFSSCWMPSTTQCFSPPDS